MVSAMRKYVIIAAAFTIALLTTLNRAVADVLIAVDERSQTMSVAVDGVEAYRWKVSTGRAGYDTPTGIFQPFRMERDHFSKEWDDAPMPYSIFFTPNGHAIHGSPCAAGPEDEKRSCIQLTACRGCNAISHGTSRCDTTCGFWKYENAMLTLSRKVPPTPRVLMERLSLSTKGMLDSGEVCVQG